jgi:hypothetical protein
MRLPASEKLVMIYHAEQSHSPADPGDARHQTIDVLSLIPVPIRRPRN